MDKDKVKGGYRGMKINPIDDRHYNSMLDMCNKELDSMFNTDPSEAESEDERECGSSWYYSGYCSVPPCQEEYWEEEETAYDLVLNPKHYQICGIEAINIIHEVTDRFEVGSDGYLIGNTLKYLLRCGLKGDKLEDLRKAQVYLNWAIDSFDKEA